ncbi:hypothetical protein HCX49_21740 [Sphingobacterium kitahiroshimense]|uniref:hypothetical protein n=1 Tax=Sphingobacterium sp. B16(2022) TaxID=2914044 RepID=UPI00143A25E0|nr:hypothetical protein [Sphingobacterium sp. B16(2022)]NJI75823.1 hypothetical protein [Sphingobacterium sp. B16(2022)]
MKNFIFILLIAVCGIIAFTFYQENKSLQLANKDLAELKPGNAYNPIIKRDTIAGKSKIVYLPAETPNNIGDYVSKSVADSLQTALKIAVKDLKSYKSFVITLQDSLKGNVYKDKAGLQWASLKDKTFDIRYNIDSNLWIPKVTIKPELLTYRTRKSIFHPYKYNSAIIVDDSRAEISFVQDFTKIKQPSRWGIGAFGGPIMTPVGLSYGVGLGLTYDLISF